MEEVTPDRKYWREILDQTLASGAYQELHAHTQLKELMSVMGTVSMGESVLAMVPDEDKEQLQELQQASNEASQLQQQAQQAQAQANATGMLANAAAEQADGNGAGDGQEGDQSQGQPSGGLGEMSPEQAKEIADQFAEQAQQAKANAEALQKQFETANSKLEEITQSLMGVDGSQEAFEKQRELARLGLAAAKQALEQVEEVSKSVQAWGLETGELTEQNFEEVQAVLSLIKDNPVLKIFNAMLGNLKMISARKARSKSTGDSTYIPIVEYGRDIKRMTRKQLVYLTHPALGIKAKMAWARGQLQLRGQKSEQKLGYGPVIVLTDRSGSMSGKKMIWANALTLALAHYAKLLKRTFGWVLFDTQVKKAKSWLKGLLSARDMIEIVQTGAGGGTSFESPLKKAVEMVEQDGALKKADFVLLTDGECAVSSKFLEWFLGKKKELDFHVYTVLMDVGSTTDTTAKEFSDKVLKVSDFTAKSASQVIDLL